MNPARRRKLAFRWALFALALDAAYWGIWYAVAGSVPTSTFPTFGLLHLPDQLHVSRAWDCAVVPFAMACTVYFAFSNTHFRDHIGRAWEDNPLTLVAGLISLAAVAILSWLSPSLSPSPRIVAAAIFALSAILLLVPLSDGEISDRFEALTAYALITGTVAVFTAGALWGVAVFTLYMATAAVIIIPSSVLIPGVRRLCRWLMADEDEEHGGGE